MTEETTTPESPPPPVDLKTAQEAQARLDSLMGDKAWTAKLLAGDAGTAREWNDLHAKAAETKTPTNQIDAALDGTAKPPKLETTTTGQMKTRDVVSFVEDMRKLGISDGAIKQAYEGKPVPKEEYRVVAAYKNQLMTDKEWQARYLSGDAAAMREMMLVNIVISAGKEEAF